ncbi:hypothetical protein Trydic_g6625 [Trypoxylus dichotomus]
MTLKFLQPVKQHSIELIEREYEISQEDLEEYLEEKSRPYTREKGGTLDMKYKEDALIIGRKRKRYLRSDCAKLIKNSAMFKQIFERNDVPEDFPSLANRFFAKELKPNLKNLWLSTLLPEDET